MKKILNQTLEDWKIYRNLTLDLLQIIPKNKLNFQVHQNMGSLGKQYRHIGDIQLCYFEALKTGKVDFSQKNRDYSLEKDKCRLLAFLVETDSAMMTFLKNLAVNKLKVSSSIGNLEKLILLITCAI